MLTETGLELFAHCLPTSLWNSLPPATQHDVPKTMTLPKEREKAAATSSKGRHVKKKQADPIKRLWIDCHTISTKKPACAG